MGARSGPSDIVAAALAAWLSVGAPGAWASERVDRAVTELRSLLATDDADRIVKGFVDGYMAIVADTGKLSPEALEAADAFGNLLMEAKAPNLAAPFYERALAIRKASDPDSEAVAMAAYMVAVAYFQDDQEDKVPGPLAEAFAIWRARGLGPPQALEAGLHLGKARAKAGDPAAAADVWSAALRLGAGATGRGARLRGDIVAAAEEALVGPQRSDDPAVRAARAAVTEAYGETGARQAVEAQRKRLAGLPFDAEFDASIAVQARIAEILARWMPDDAQARRSAARERARLMFLSNDVAGADRAYAEAIEQAERIAGPRSLDVADLLIDKGESRSFKSELPADQLGAADDFRRALGIYEARLAAGDRRIAVAAMRLGFVLNFLRLAGVIRDTGEVPGLLQRAAAILEAEPEPNRSLLSDVNLQLSHYFGQVGRHAEAVAHARVAVAHADRSGSAAGGGSVTERLVARSQLYKVLPPGSEAEEDRLLDEQVALAERLVETAPHWLMGALAQRAQYDFALGRYAGADRAARRAAAIGIDPQDREAPAALEILARIARFFGRRGDAADLFDRAADLVEARAVSAPDIILGVRMRGQAAGLRDDYRAAVAHFERLIALQNAAFGPDDPGNAEGHTLLGIAHWNLGELAAAEPELRRALELESRSLDVDRSGLSAKRANLARLLTALGRPAEAVPLFAESEREYEAGNGAGPAARAEVAGLHADALVAIGRGEEALAAARRAVAIVASRVDGDAPGAEDPTAASVRDAEIRRSSAIFVSRVRAAWAASR